MKNLQEIESVAYSRYTRISPSKVRRVLDQIRGLPLNDALIILKFMPYKSCGLILKVLYSAFSNAKTRFDIDQSKFYVSEARADAGPFLKRICPHAQGRAFPIKKYMSHIVSAV
uniref:Large ribosomal subunit protein uL22c n=1 Tax=Euglenaformis proxima TaxID=299110 RepID=A0A023HI08_9EUGL|nr:ribosomal protein L22 [Euglenaformis proxima]AGL12004.1 ribosomal protein L22 [Euglenaformis proxima]